MFRERRGEPMRPTILRPKALLAHLALAKDRCTCANLGVARMTEDAVWQEPATMRKTLLWCILLGR